MVGLPICLPAQCPSDCIVGIQSATPVSTRPHGRTPNLPPRTVPIRLHSTASSPPPRSAPGHMPTTTPSLIPRHTYYGAPPPRRPRYRKLALMPEVQVKTHSPLVLLCFLSVFFLRGSTHAAGSEKWISTSNPKDLDLTSHAHTPF